MKKTFTTIIAAVLLTVLTLSAPCTAYAGSASVIDDSSYFTCRDGYVYAAVPESGDSETSLSIALDKAEPSVNLTTLDSFYYYTSSDGVTTCCIKEEDFNNLLSISQQCDAWVSANLASIVPSGTSYADVPAVIAAWEAAHMVYDEAAHDDPVLCRSYQSALSCFTSGTGVCSTYALAFDTLVQAVPINPESGLVDYTCANPVHYEARYVQNSDHAWSAIRFGESDTWHFYDITFYDSDGASDRTEYLDMSASALADGYHNNPNAFE